MKQKEAKAALKALTSAELQERLTQQEVALTQKSIDHAVSPVDSPAAIRGLRREIAQIKTILRERELNK